MKFDVFSWDEVKTNEKIEVPKGWLRLRLSAPCPVYVEAEGYEVLAGYGASFDLEISEAVTFRVEASKGVRAFRNAPPVTSVKAQGEVYTNIDRQPFESGMMAEVTRARRLFEMEKRAMLRDIRVEAAKARDLLKQVKPAEPAPDPVDPDSFEPQEGEQAAE